MSVQLYFKQLLGRLRTPVADACEPARAPDGCCIYAVGDIHGELRLLRQLLERIEADAAAMWAEHGLRPLVVFLGDYVDRGPESRGVLEHLLNLRQASQRGGGVACRFLRGNHEEGLLAFLRDPVKASDWLRFGGVETLASYGVVASAGLSDPARFRALAAQFADRLDPLHRLFLEDLEQTIDLGDYLFVHAGVRPGVPLDRQQLEDLLWIREPFLSSRKFHGKVVVHGHTIVERVEDRGNRIAIDTGAYATGCLTAMVLHGTQRRMLQTERWAGAGAP